MDTKEEHEGKRKIHKRKSRKKTSSKSGKKWENAASLIQCQVQQSNWQRHRLHATQQQREGRGPCRNCAKWPQNGMEIRLYQYFMCYRLLRLLPSLIMTLVSPDSSLSPLRSTILYQFLQAICANLARPARISVAVCLRPIQSRIAYHTWRKLSGLIVKKYLKITEKVLIVH